MRLRGKRQRGAVLRPAEDHVERHADRRREGDDREQPARRGHAERFVIEST